MPSLRRTPLYDFHRDHGGRFVEFGGWEMPVQYRSILEEHRAVRSAAGLFDVSHMGEIRVSGTQSTEFLNHLVTNDVTRLSPGRVLYTPMCLPSGGVVDDLLITCLGPSEYLLCVNASNRDKDLAWMTEQAFGYDCTIKDQSDAYGLLAIQGPRADAIVGRLTPVALERVRYYGFAEGDVAGTFCLISRTGYTGERGFELFCPADEASGLAGAILEAGEPEGLVLAGLGARDSLRLEAGFSLYGHEISELISPLEAGLEWTVKFSKDGFIGRQALLRQRDEGTPSKVVFFRTGDRRIVRAGSTVFAGAREVGRVLSGTLSPMRNEAIGSMHVLTECIDEDLSVDLRGQQQFLLKTKPPFVPIHR
ncbi:MAG: glycine cleavage system aminomethyltransferase GcvT [Opitutaceae bacterium]